MGRLPFDQKNLGRSCSAGPRGAALLAVIALAAGLLAGCSSSANTTTGGLQGLTVSDHGQRAQRVEDDDDRPSAVPADPYRSVRYKGGRDPGSGVAPGLDGQLPPPPAPAKAAGATRARTAAAQPAAADGAAGAARLGTVTVQAGDTLYGIANRHRVSVSALMQANKLSSATIVPGQQLVLPR